MTDTRGPLYPADQLLAWLDKHKSDPAQLGGTELRIPVFVTLSENKMKVVSATVGDKPDALAIKLNDRTMNIPVAGKLPMFYGEDATKGLLWLQGMWRGGETKEFQVTRIEGKAEGADATGAEIVK